MFQPSNSMPIENYSVVQPSTQQKTFSENNICRFSLPYTSIPFFDPHESYLQVIAETTGDAKVELNGNSSVIIKYIRLSVNGQVLEEIDEFNQLANIYNVYGNDDSSRAQESVFTLDSKELFTTGLMGNQSASVDNGVKKCKLIIPMKECGLFSALEIVPLMAFGNNLDVEIRFAPNNEVLRAYNRNSKDKNDPNDTTAINVSDALTNGAAITTLNLALPYMGFTSLGDIPLQIGDRFTLKKNDGTAVTGIGAGDIIITSLERTATTAVTDNPNQIVVGFATETPTADVNANDLYIHISKTTNNATTIVSTITYSNVEWYIQKVVPPQQYVGTLTKQLQSAQGFQYDIHTWTTYKSSLLEAVQSQTIEIPAYQSRAKSVIVIPRRANQNPILNVSNGGNDNGTKHYSFNGQFQNLKDYQWQVNNGLRVPTRPINLEVMRGSCKHLGAEHLIQLTQALGSSNIGVRNLKDAHNNFMMGRQLSKYGGTSRLTSAMRVYLNWHAGTDPAIKLQPITFINHINRVSINSQGLQVFN